MWLVPRARATLINRMHFVAFTATTEVPIVLIAANAAIADNPVRGITNVFIVVNLFRASAAVFATRSRFVRAAPVRANAERVIWFAKWATPALVAAIPCAK